MKNTLILRILAAGFLIANAGEASPAYRFWRGYRRPELSAQDFNSAISKVFIPSTVEAGAGRGLRAYLPALTKPAAGDFLFPDEVALVVYESKEIYDAFKALDIGKNYSNLHWSYFVGPAPNPPDPPPANLSKSLTPEELPAAATQLASGKAYDLIGGTPDWQKGEAKVRFFERRPDRAAEIAAVKKLAALAPAGLLVLVDDNYLLVYELWASADAHEASKVEEFVRSNFVFVGGNDIAIAKTGNGIANMRELDLKPGEGASAQFADLSYEYADENSLDTYAVTQIESNYPTSTELFSLGESTKDNYTNLAYHVTYSDDDGRPVTYSVDLGFTFWKSKLSPAGKVLVVDSLYQILN